MGKCHKNKICKVTNFFIPYQNFVSDNKRQEPVQDLSSRGPIEVYILITASTGKNQFSA